MNQPPPNRIPRSPTRTIGILANVVSLLIVLGSFGGCMKWGFQTNHLSEDAAYSRAFGSGIACVLCAVVAVIIFAVAGGDRTKDRTTSVAGVIFSILWGIASAVLAMLFWACTSSSTWIVSTGEPAPRDESEITGTPRDVA